VRARLTPAFIAKAKATGKHQAVYWDEALPGFGLMVTPLGHKSFVVQYRANGKSRRATIKFGPGLEAARRRARAIQGKVADGGDPVGEKRAALRAAGTTLKAVIEAYFNAEGDKLRSAAAQRSVFGRLVLPTLGARPIGEIKRGEIIALLDTIEQVNGPRMATSTLAFLRRAMAWHSVRDEDFHTPIVRGMERGRAVRRDRILNDDEVRAFWTATTDQADPYSRMVRFILLTATRLQEAAGLRWQELQGDTWIIPASRYKTGIELELPLSAAARVVLASLPRVGREGWVFTLGGKTKIGNFTEHKANLDARMVAALALGEHCSLAPGGGEGSEPSELRKAVGTAALPRWTTHDLRRSARSLMSRAGVPADHAERCLGHVIGGVRGVYDRHAFVEEKRAAFEALAGMIDRIINPTENVVQLGRRG
jgi:integrase